MKPTWKIYDIEAWEHGVAGCSPRSFPVPTDRFLWNNCGVCTNPHVLGIAGRGWRIGIFTAQTPSGLWSHNRDISLPQAGYGGLPRRLDFDARTSEDKAQCAELELAAAFVVQNADPKRVSCPIPRRDADILLRLIREKLAELTAPKLPIYTQLSLFD